MSEVTAGIGSRGLQVLKNILGLMTTIRSVTITGNAIPTTGDNVPSETMRKMPNTD